MTDKRLQEFDVKPAKMSGATSAPSAFDAAPGIKICTVILHYGDPALAQGLSRQMNESRTHIAADPNECVHIFDNAAPVPYANAWRRATHNGYWTGALQTCLHLAQEQGYTHLWFLNNDIAFVTPPPSTAEVQTRLFQLGQTLGHPVGIWSPAVLHSPYHPQMCHKKGLQACQVKLVDGIAPVYALDCVAAIGGLDAADNPYGYGVEMWLSLRAGRAGWPLIVDHRFVIRHRHHTTAKIIDGFMTRAAVTEEAYMRARLGTRWREYLETLKN